MTRSADTSVARPGDLDPPPARRRLSTHAATVGLVLVLAVLTVFSVTASVVNARVAEQAQRSAEVSQWSEQAE